MGSLPRVLIAVGERGAAPLYQHLQQLAGSTKAALVYKDDNTTHSVTYAELESESNALARCIVNKARAGGANVDGDFVVGVCMQPTHDTVTTILAIWKAGAAYVPMEPSFPQPRIDHILVDAEPSLVIYDDTASSSMFTRTNVTTTSISELMDESTSHSSDVVLEDERLAPTGEDSIAIILYTSGSTGIPKGVRLPYTAICNRLWWQFTEFPFVDTETVCIWKTALTFVDSVCEMWAPLLKGRTLLILAKETTRDPEKLVAVMAEHKVHRLVLVPTLLRSILMYLSLNPKERHLKHLKLWVCSGETLSKDLAAQFFKYFGDDGDYKLANFYGSTEVMGDVTYYVMENSMQLDNFPTIPIGSPLSNCGIYLLDSNMSLVKAGTVGELWVSGRNLARGYVRGAGAERFLDNPHTNHPDFTRLYRTGDFAVQDKDIILYAGRSDSQVKIRGNRVDLMEVERAVNAVAGVDKGVVLCYGLEMNSPEILAFVTLKNEARISAHKIETALKDMLTSYMLPQVIVIEKFPLLVNGKVDRQSLLKMYENTNNNDDASIPIDIDYSGIPSHQATTAKVLLETVADVLGRGARDVISLSKGFYQLGGDSLNSIYTISRLKEQGYYIKISDFLQAETLDEVLSKMSSTEKEEVFECKFKPEPMKDCHREKVIEMIVSSFYEKAELEQFVKHEIETTDYRDVINSCWPHLLAARLSTVLVDANGEPVSVALNFDARDEPDIELSGGLAKIMGFLEHVEGAVRDSMLPAGKGTVLHSFMMASASHLTAQENIEAFRAMEHATMRVAREYNFKGVFTTNTSPLTQQLGRDVLGFNTLLDYQINEYVDENDQRIFGAAPDDMRAVVCWKPLE